MDTLTRESPLMHEQGHGHRVLVVDIDSTIWDMTSWTTQAISSLYGIEYKYEDHDTWGYFYDIMKPEQVHSVFDVVLDPRRVMARPWYPSCQETLRYLYRSLGIELHFVSHNHYPERMIEPITRWLKRSLGFDDFVVEIGRVDELDKVDYAREVGAFGLIDDKEETLKDAYRENVHQRFLLATKVHPWNRELSQGADAIARGFTSWTQVNGMVKRFWDREEEHDLQA